ncbi:hypothetical protein DXG01_005897 [Tephrocybe rancida]|nr:hypothetical protein DXG01_005897 [Tephrocybe rancida]
MSDDDDYFTDDIFFDDQTLAILDREEKKFLSQATVKTIPPTKRQKTDSGWKAGIGASANEPDFLPEISLNLGGSYGILRGTSHSTTGAAHKPPPSTTNAPSRAHHGQILAPFPKPPLAPRAVQHVSRNPPTRTFQNSRPPTGSPNDGQRSISRTEPAHTALDVWPVSIAHSPSNLPSRSEFLHADQKPGLEARLQELQQKLEQICEENKTIQVALNEAMNAKLAKEGEVTILRKNAEKVSQEHAAQLAKLKAAREEAELKQARMQKDLREETERLKTQLVFKQHEQESIHRPPPSVRPKKFLKDASFIANSTPSRLRHPHQQDEPLGRQVAQKGFVSQTQPLKTPQIKRSSMLPGFENAFSDAAPLHPSKNSDKRRRIQSPDPVSPSKQRRMFTAGADVSMEISAEETFMESAHIDLDGDIDMPFGTSVEDGRFPKVEEQDEDMDETTHTMEPPEWKVELNRIVLMHLLPISHTLTMQLLLGAQIPPDLEDGQSDAYTTACSRCLEVIANAFHCEQDWRHSVDCLSNSLSSMVPLLRTARAVLPLAALLNLLAVLVYSLPDFGSSILSRPSDGTNDSQILIHISAIILDQREIEKQDSHEALATEVVTLLEALSFTVDPELVGKTVRF